MKQPLISICIPTYERVEILRNTLNSIFSQNVDLELYEVCISDNSPNDNTKEMLNEYFSDKKNIYYKKTKCEGYYNSIEALKLGKGKLLKLHNNYSKFIPGSFENFVNFISENIENKSILFFTSGSLKSVKEIENYHSFNSFLNSISIFSTWSSSFCIWKDHFDLIIFNNLKLDKMFPHTSLLFYLSDKKDYIVNNILYFDNQDVEKKGGYNIPETFGTRYLKMCENLYINQKIDEKTLQKIKDDVLQFIKNWYVNVTFFGNKYTFSFENWEKIITNLYNKQCVDYIKNYIKKNKIKYFIKKILKKY